MVILKTQNNNLKNFLQQANHEPSLDRNARKVQRTDKVS